MEHVIDNLIIGAGIGGTYLAARLVNMFQDEKLLIIDKMDDFGGLQINSQIENTDTIIELGPIRFYDKIHHRIKYLVEKYEIPIIEYLSDPTGQVYYLRNKIIPQENVISETENIYFINEDEKGKDPFTLLRENLSKFNFNNTNITNFETRIELFKEKVYSKMVFQSLGQQNISQENWQRIEDINGYKELLSTKINFIVELLETLPKEKFESKQFRFKHGYNSLTKEIASKNNITKICYNSFFNNEIIDNSNFSKALFNTAVLDIVPYNNSNTPQHIWKVTIGNVNVNSPEQISYKSITSQQTIYAKNIYSTASLNCLKHIHKFNHVYNSICENNFVTYQSIRIFLHFETDWMNKYGIGYGRSITSLNGSQLIHYSENVLMFYALSSNCSKLYGLLPDNIQIQREMVEPNEKHFPLIEECIQIIQKTYGIYDDEIKKIKGISYASWSNSIRCYSGRNTQTLSDDTLYDILLQIMFPYGENGNFYVLENSSSFNSTWCEGSIELVDFFMNKKYNHDLFGVKYIN